MNTNVKKRRSCRLCDSKEVKVVIPLEKIPLTEKYLSEDELNTPVETYPIDVYMCLTCGCVQLLDVINPKILWDDFTFRSGQAPIIVDHMDEVASKTCEEYAIPKGSLVIDVGSNDGTFLNCFKNNGMTVLGVDPAKEIAQEANKAGINTIPDFLTKKLAKKITQEHGKAALVTCFNAFAHADDMNELMSSISMMVANDGLFLFEVSYLVDIIDELLLGAIIHEHLCNHSVTPIEKFLKRHNMELINVERNPFQGGSFIGTAQQMGGSRLIKESVPELLEMEKKRRFTDPSTIENFSKRLDALVKKFEGLILKWESEGSKIAGYGAARSGPTLLSQFNIGNKINFVFDDHPQKVDKYTPGDKIKVLPTYKLLNLMPKYTIILAWVHAETIINNNQRYLDEGGNFVVLLPEIKIISKEGSYKY